MGTGLEVIRTNVSRSRADFLHVTDAGLTGPQPRPGDDIRGTMWLQECLAEGDDDGA